MPLNIDFVQVLLHMLNFVILAGGLSLILFKPVSRFMEERKKHFEELASENAKAAAENQRLKEEYEEKLASVDEEIAGLRADAEKEAADAAKTYLDSAKEKANAIVQNAEAEAEARKKQILESAQTEISELVLSAAQKLVSSTENEERTHALYDAFLKEAEKENASGREKRR